MVIPMSLLKSWSFMMKPSINLELILIYPLLYCSWFSHHRDGKMPVSFIQKYLVKKLDLDSETEVCSSLLPPTKYNFLVGLLVKLLWFSFVSSIVVCWLFIIACKRSGTDIELVTTVGCNLKLIFLWKDPEGGMFPYFFCAWGYQLI